MRINDEALLRKSDMIHDYLSIDMQIEEKHDSTYVFDDCIYVFDEICALKKFYVFFFFFSFFLDYFTTKAVVEHFSNVPF